MADETKRWEIDDEGFDYEAETGTYVYFSDYERGLRSASANADRYKRQRDELLEAIKAQKSSRTPSPSMPIARRSDLWDDRLYEAAKRIEAES